MVRIHLTEAERSWAAIFARLRDEEKAHGVTVFRGVSGFGPSGRARSARRLDLSLDLPVVVEFFDTPERIGCTLGDLDDILPAGHVVSRSARLNEA